MEVAGGLEARRIKSEYVKLGIVQLIILLYADDLVLISRTAGGLQRLLNLLEGFVGVNKLKVNTKKTKVLGIRGGS